MVSNSTPAKITKNLFKKLYFTLQIKENMNYPPFLIVPQEKMMNAIIILLFMPTNARGGGGNM